MTLATDIVVEVSSYPAPALTSTRPTRHRFTWADLAERFSKHRRSDTKNVAGWSPAIYEQGRTRSNDAVVSVSCAVGDFDHCTFDDLTAVKERLAELELTYVLYSTYSNDPEAANGVAFRVVVPFSAPVHRNDWAETWLRVNHHVFLGKNDPQTKDLSRFFYVPSAPHDALVFAEHGDGTPLDVSSLPAAPVGPASSLEHEPLDYRNILDGIPEGERDWTLYRMACDMRGKGFPIEMALLAIAAAAERCVPPFDALDAEKKVIEAYRHFSPNAVLPVGDESVTAASLLDAAHPFPIDALPEAFQRYVEHVARLKVCPPEYVAVPLLVAAGTTLGNVARIRLNATWYERPNLFAVLVGDPGSKKTPASQQAIRPVSRLQHALSTEWKKKHEQYKRQLSEWETTPKKERGPQPQAPIYPHVMVNDVTIEKLADVLSTSKGVILAMDELAAWVRGMDQYRGGKGADRQHFLSMWSGTTIKVDRKSNPAPIVVESPCLGIVGGIQPEMLTEFSDSKGRNDGFLDRLLWCYPDSMPDRWVDDDGATDNVEELDEIFRSLYASYGSTNLVGDHVALDVRFSPEADRLWAFWYAEHAEDRNNGNLPQNLSGPWAKMASQLARIALILHMIDGENNFVSAETLGRAIRIIEYFKAHARKVFAELGEARGGMDIKIIEALKKHGDMTQHEIRRRVFGGHVAGEKIRGVLAELRDRGIVTSAEIETKGRTATVWSVA